MSNLFELTGLTTTDACRQFCKFLNERLGLVPENQWDEDGRYYQIVLDHNDEVHAIQFSGCDDDIPAFHLSLDSMALITGAMTPAEQDTFISCIVFLTYDRYKGEKYEDWKSVAECGNISVVFGEYDERLLVFADAPTRAAAAILCLGLGKEEGN